MVSIERKNGKIIIESPYNKEFIDGIKNLGGKWDIDRRLWSVAEIHEAELNKLLIEAYNIDVNMQKPKQVIVEYKVSDFFAGNGQVKVGNLVTAQRISRDWKVKLYFDTAIILGGFPDKGGSVKYPSLDSEEGTTLRTSIPLSVYENLSDDIKSKLILK